MSPSLRKLTPEYVKAHVKNAKIPLSSSGRFNLKSPRQLRERLRTLTADFRGLFEDKQKSSTSLLSYGSCNDLRERGYDGLTEMSATSDVSAYQDGGRTAGAPLGEISVESSKIPNTEVDTGGSTYCYESNVGEVSSCGADSLNIEYIGGCSLKACLNVATAYIAPDLASLPMDDSQDGVCQHTKTWDSCDVASPSSSISDDILAALDAFDADVDALSRATSVDFERARSLQTIWEEDSTMFHSHCSVDDAQAEHEDALRNTSSVLLSKPFEGPTNSSATISVLRVYQGLTSGVAQAQPVGYRDIVLPYYRLSPCLLQTPGSTFLVLEKGDSECDEVD